MLGAGLFVPGHDAYLLPAATQAFAGAPAARLSNQGTAKENGYFLYFMPTFTF